MADLQFDNQNDEFGRPPQASGGTDMTGKLIQWGFVASREEANYVLIGIAVLAVLATIFVLRSF